MYAKIRDTELYFDVAGMQFAPKGNTFEKRPVLFLLHGGPGGDHLRFKIHSLALQDVAQLVFIDHRGCGFSKKTKASDYTLENNIEDIEALRKHLGLDKICILGGSYGGMVAQGYAIRYPQNVEKLILVVTSPSYRFMESAKYNLKTRGTPAQIKVCENLWAGNFKSTKECEKYFKIMEPLYSVKVNKSKKSPYPKSHNNWSHEALNQGFGGFMRTFDFIPHLKKIKAPTLIVAGEKDWICDPKEAKVMAKHIPNSKLKIFKNAGHAVAHDANKLYLKTVKNFLTQSTKKSKVKKRKKS